MEPELYCLDDTCFIGLLDKSANIIADIHTLVDVADHITSEGQSISVPSNIEFIQIGEGLFFYDLYDVDFSQSDKSGGLDRDAVERFLALRKKLDTIAVTDVLSASLYDSSGVCARDVHESGTAKIIVQRQIEGGECFALLLVGPNGPAAGEYHLHIDNKLSNKLYAIRTSSDLQFYARWLIRDISQSEEDFFSLWDRAFPLLLKSNDLTFKRFDGNYLGLYKDVLNHLVFLNDDFLHIWLGCHEDFVCFQRNAKSLGINLSNEGDNTRKNKRKMKQRIASFSKKDVECELHTKLSYDKNRIHFHPPIETIGGTNVLIGIFVNHLET